MIPKLIRWGIDAHMGVLFGLPNQILMAGVAIGLMVTIAYGYRMWWVRRPAAGELPLAASWARLSAPGRALWLVSGLCLGWALPILGLSLLAFVLIDVLRWRAAKA